MSAAQLPIVALDESTCDNFVTAGGVFVPAARTENVLDALREVKRLYGIVESAEIHCRLLFAGQKRTKTPFKVIQPNNLIPFLTHCVMATAAAGCRWYGMYCDAEKYPKRFRFVEGGDFVVTQKHIAAILVKPVRTEFVQWRETVLR